MSCAIITSSLGATSQTFVSQHIQNLFEGDNVVIFQSGNVKNAFNKPICKINLPWWYQYPKPIRTFAQALHFLRYFDKNVPDRNEQIKILSFLKDHKVKVLFAEFGPLGSMMVPIANKAGIPIFTYFRGYDASKLLNDWKQRAAYKKMIPKMEGIFSVSPHLLDNLKDIGVQWKQAHIVPSGTDTELFKPGNKDPNLLLSVGRFVDKKAPKITIKAFAQALKFNPNIKLVMIGTGPLLGECKELAVSLKLEDKIEFTGAQSRDFVCNYMARASIFLLHSVVSHNGDTEGFPSVIQEAMASGCAIISTKHAGIPHFIKHGETGLLSEEYDVDMYSYFIRKVLSDKDLVSEMGTKSRKYAVEVLEYRMLYQKVESIVLKKYDQ